MSIVDQSGYLGLFFAFVIAHALADFPLQGDYLAREKQRRTASSRESWIVALSAHSAIHAGGVWIVSGLALVGLVELILHWLIDWGKGEDRFGYATDQILHLACKACYVLVIFWIG